MLQRLAVDKLDTIQEEYLDYLEDGEKFVAADRTIELDMLRKSFRPTFSDGKMVFRFSDAVAKGAYESAAMALGASLSQNSFGR